MFKSSHSHAFPRRSAVSALVAVGLGLAACAVSPLALAQTYPNKPIKVVLMFRRVAALTARHG